MPCDLAERRIPEYGIVNPQAETITVLHSGADANEENLLPGFYVPVATVFDSA